MIERLEGDESCLLTAATAKVDYELLARIDRLLTTDLLGLFPGDPEKAGLKHLGVVVYKLGDNGVAFAFGLEFADTDKAKQAREDFDKVHKVFLQQRIFVQLKLDTTEADKIPVRASSASKPKSSSSPSKKKDVAEGSVTVRADGTTVILTARLTWPESAPDLTSPFSYQLTEFLRTIVAHEKGVLDMEGPRSTLEELAQAVRNYVQAKQAETKAEDRKFPRGALDRKIPPDRFGIPWPVRERLSWLVELLPYLPNSDIPLYLKSENGLKAFKTRDTATPLTGEWSVLSHILIPEFLVERRTAEEAWWIQKIHLNPLAATHVVGVAGVGLNIASEKDLTNPKVGIFGYERETRFDLIKGKEDRIILMIQIPVYLPAGLQRKEYGPVYPTPWMIGGGTVRGIPETDSLNTFLCTERNGKVGTHVIMADGTVRFLAKGVITDAEFLSLCTIQGDKPTLERLDQIAPKVSK
jgi:hypothetical protein